MVGAESLTTARLPTVIGAISQGFGGAYQDRLPFADYLKRALKTAIPGREAKGTG
jgi:hypothetical protein